MKQDKQKKEENLEYRLRHHFICVDCTEKESTEIIFYNNDDNVCAYCGSKNTYLLRQVRLKAIKFL